MTIIDYLKPSLTINFDQPFSTTMMCYIISVLMALGGLQTFRANACAKLYPRTTCAAGERRGTVIHAQLANVVSRKSQCSCRDWNISTLAKLNLNSNDYCGWKVLKILNLHT